MTTDPDARPPLDPDRLAAGVEILACTPSTNAVAAERARAGAAARQVVVTEHQVAGRGRLGRTWTVPERAALTFSLLLRPALEPGRWPWLPLFTGYAVHQALCAELPDLAPRLGLKWPNDLLVLDPEDQRETRKLAGILVERVETDDGPAAVLGVGLNVSQTRDELPVETASSLELETGQTVDRTALLARILASLGEREPLLGQPEALRAAYEATCLTLGREVRVELPSARPLAGTATSVDGTGRLVVEAADGLHRVGAGDVVHVRASEV